MSSLFKKAFEAMEEDEEDGGLADTSDEEESDDAEDSDDDSDESSSQRFAFPPSQALLGVYGSGPSLLCEAGRFMSFAFDLDRCNLTAPFATPPLRSGSSDGEGSGAGSGSGSDGGASDVDGIEMKSKREAKRAKRKLKEAQAGGEQKHFSALDVVSVSFGYHIMNTFRGIVDIVHDSGMLRRRQFYLRMSADGQSSHTFD